MVIWLVLQFDVKAFGSVGLLADSKLSLLSTWSLTVN